MSTQIPFTLPTCQGWGVQARQHLVLSRGRQRLETEKELLSTCGADSRVEGSVLVPTPPLSYLGVLDKKASAMAIGALGTLPAAGTADAAHTALAAHAIPVTCCRGTSKGVRAPAGPANS